MGVIKLFAGTYAPAGWAFCNGQLMSINRYSSVFSLLGTTYGGDGIQTFALPDLRGRVPLGAGKGPQTNDYALGQMDGAETVNLVVDNIPAHNHVAQLLVSSAEADTGVAARGASIATPGSSTGRTFTATLGYKSVDPDITLNAKSITVSSVGSASPVKNMQPYLGMNYIICLDGIYPPRP